MESSRTSSKGDIHPHFPQAKPRQSPLRGGNERSPPSPGSQTVGSRKDLTGRRPDGAGESAQQDGQRPPPLLQPRPHLIGPTGNNIPFLPYKKKKNTTSDVVENTVVYAATRQWVSSLLPFPPNPSLFSTRPDSNRATLWNGSTFHKGAVAICHSGSESRPRAFPHGARCLPASPPAAAGSSRCLPQLIMPCHAVTELWSHTGFTCHK